MKEASRVPVASTRPCPSYPFSLRHQTSCPSFHSSILQLLISSTLFSHILPAHLPPTRATRRQFSPLHRLSLDRPYPPIFLAIPENDQMVPPSQTWVFAERLKELGFEFECARANGAGHAFDFSGGPRNEEGGDWYENVVRKGLDFLLMKLEL
jgi:acetyl esterase/lipase